MNIKVKKTKAFFVYYIIAVLLLVIAVFIAPIWGNTKVVWKDWGNNFIYLIISILLIIYLFGYLLRKMLKKKNDSVFISRVVEFTLVCVFTIMCIINHFTNFMDSFLSVSKVLGLVLLVHGISGLVGNYLTNIVLTGKEKNLDFIFFLLNIFLVSLGSILIAVNVIKNAAMLWIFAIIVLCTSIFCIVIGSLSIPKSKKIKNKDKKESK